MFAKVLVANRGEIAVRIIRTLRTMGIASVAVFSEADRHALHVEVADEAVCIGPADAASSYLNIANVVAAARATGAEAVHPGYGFLSENADFARACADAGVAFIGPSAESIVAMGDKIRAKATVIALGLPTVPGFSEPDATDETLLGVAPALGFPLIVKPSAGGGGKGMRVVHSIAELAPALASARREARAAFGDDTLMLERFIEFARHVEVQVIADRHGLVLHVGDRDCSLQRRHQKVVEEAPAPFLPPEVRARMLQASVAIAASVQYEGVGTVEFVVDANNPEDHYFLEMNTRLQVEHPVTELVTGLDLVQLQLRIASGESLGLTQDDITVTGHAVEARVYAEDGNRGFLPSSGTLLRYSVPADVRVDSGVRQGDVVGTNYDPLLFKVIAWAEDRSAALARTDAALARCAVLGVANNIQVLRTLVGLDDVRAGNVTTRLIGDRQLGSEPAHPTDSVWVAAALSFDDAARGSGGSTAWDLLDGWRVGDAAPRRWALTSDTGESREVRVTGRGDERFAQLADGPVVRASLSAGAIEGQQLLLGDRATVISAAVDDRTAWVSHLGCAFELTLPSPELLDADGEHGSVDVVRSPMPGTVVLVGVAEGDLVTKGAVLVVVEAMKMEYPLLAPHDGVVAALRAQVGTVIAKDAALAEVVPVGAAGLRVA